MGVKPVMCALSRAAQEVARCQATDARLSLAQVCAAYRGLQAGYREEYVLYSLASAALAQVRPIIVLQPIIYL